MPGILFTSIGWGNFGLNVQGAQNSQATHNAEDEIFSRRMKLKETLSLRSLVFMNQTHSNTALLVNGSESIVQGDAIVTGEKNVGLAVLAGDCLPILVRSGHGVAAIHAGREGMVNGVAGKAIELLRSLGNSSIEAIIGPSICAECYEVSSVMYDEVISIIPASATHQDVHCLDLQSGVASQLTSEGIEVLNMGICTQESTEFYSHRRSGATGQSEGRQVGVIYL